MKAGLILLFSMFILTGIAGAQEFELTKEIDDAYAKYNQVRADNAKVVAFKVLPYVSQKTGEFLKKKDLKKQDLETYSRIVFFGLYFDISGDIISIIYPLYKKHKNILLQSMDDIQTDAKELLQKEITHYEMLESM